MRQSRVFKIKHSMRIILYINSIIISKKKNRKILVYIRLDAKAVVHKLDILNLVYFHIYISN